MTALCRSCRAPIVWCVTTTGKSMPVDAEPAPDGNVLLSADGRRIMAQVLGPGDRPADPDQARHMSHFATCPNAADHRRG